MTTVIARNKVLVADRRKIVNYRKLDVIGVRNEAKIYKEPFCLYGVAGYEATPAINGYGMSRELLLRRLAVLFALSYYTESKEKRKLLYGLPGASPIMIESMVASWGEMRTIMGMQVARELNEFSQSVVAMGQFNTMHFTDGEFLTMPNTDTVLLGAGARHAVILIDNGYSYDKIYPALRRAGVPTGETYDMFTVEDDLPDLMPPISHPTLVRTIATLMRKAIRWEMKKGMLTPESAIGPRRALAENLATFLSLGNTLRGNYWVFSKKPIWDWTTPQSKKHRHYQLACNFVGIKAEKENKEESKS